MEHLPQQDIYDDHGRPEVAALIPSGCTSALDVGCGPGGFGRSLRERLGPDARIVGVEPVPAQARVARTAHGFDEVIDGYFPDAFGDRRDRFDLVSFNDVLEHLWDPWQVLEGTHDRLTPGGHVLAAIPSIQYLPVVSRLVRGRWDYTDGGTLDRTHVRFFTRATMLEMVEGAGYEVIDCQPANSMFQFARYRRWRPLRHLIGNGEWMHFVVLGRSRR